MEGLFNPLVVRVCFGFSDSWPNLYKLPTMQWSPDNAPEDWSSTSEHWPSSLTCFFSDGKNWKDLPLDTNGTGNSSLSPQIWVGRGHIKTLIEPFREHNPLEIISQSLLKGPAEWNPEGRRLQRRPFETCQPLIPEILLHPAAELPGQPGVHRGDGMQRPARRSPPLERKET